MKIITQGNKNNILLGKDSVVNIKDKIQELEQQIEELKVIASVTENTNVVNDPASTI